MKILYLCQVFETGDSAGSERHFYFCKHAVKSGHSAAAITSNVDYKKAKVKIEGASGVVMRTFEGVDVFYVYSYANFRGSYFKRFYYYVTYFWSSIACSFKLDRPDVIYAVSTPLTVGLLGYFISRLRGIPFVFEVTDVWPDAAIECGVVRNRFVIFCARLLEMFCYAKAAHIVGLTAGICENIVSKGVDEHKVSVITNGVDLSLFSPLTEVGKRNEIRARLNISNKLVAMYMGAHGAYNALDTIINAAITFKGNSNIVFIFVGDGDEKQRLKNSVAINHLSNVLFLEPVPRIESPALLSAADLFLLPNRKGEYFAGNLPNKLFDYMASGRPVLVSGIGESPELVLKARCGKVCAPEDGLSLKLALDEFIQMTAAERSDMGMRGRRYVLEYFDRSLLSEKYLDVLARVVA
jgi:glycosyltransferase involved in cell wall biosynthesis